MKLKGGLSEHSFIALCKIIFIQYIFLIKLTSDTGMSFVSEQF